MAEHQSILEKNFYNTDSNWAEIIPKLKRKSLKTTVLQFKEVSGDALKGKKRDETVVRTSKICQVSNRRLSDNSSV